MIARHQRGGLSRREVLQVAPTADMGHGPAAEGRLREVLLMATIRLLGSWEHDSSCSFVVKEDLTGRTLPFQTDWDWPSLAATFGWQGNPDSLPSECDAEEWLRENAGATAEDPGYFSDLRPSWYDVRRWYQRFRGRTGCIGQDALSAWQLAKARCIAELAEWEFGWPWDDCPDLSWMSDEERQKEHEVLGCVLRDSSGNVRDSLWGIVDPDDEYARLVEAELALEALGAIGLADLRTEGRL